MTDPASGQIGAPVRLQHNPLCDERHCITCGDDGTPMTVLTVDEARGLALCATDEDRHETVEIALVDAVAPGDRLLVHAATAIARVTVR